MIYHRNGTTPPNTDTNSLFKNSKKNVAIQQTFWTDFSENFSEIHQDVWSVALVQTSSIPQLLP